MLILRRPTLPDNAAYYYAAYLAGAAIFIAYAVTLTLRRRAVRRRGYSKS